MDDAAAIFVEGAFITSDGNLREALVKLYEDEMDPRSCALIPGPHGPAINPACAIVQAHLCAASRETVSTLVRAGKRDLAKTRKKMFVQEFGCDKSPLDEALQ